ncbi:hypothetical protein [Streptomyces sp. NPDC021356]|uniref:hypothetical protein n=1 Tax=Streptomyces sp. NPDC021356 TaxID=3154900 RepID=UPI0033CE828C
MICHRTAPRTPFPGRASRVGRRLRTVPARSVRLAALAARRDPHPAPRHPAVGANPA